MDIVVIMDPPSTVIVDEDTSFALMYEAQERGHRVYHCLIHELFLEGDRLGAHLRLATLHRDQANPMILGKQELRWLDETDVVLMRKDPPFNPDYLWATLLLEHLRGKTLVMNDPRALRDANEKIFPSQFSQLMPRTLITADKKQIREFVDRVGGQAVIKPIDGAGGSGVLLLRAGDMNFNTIFEVSTRNGKQMAVVQEFLPKVSDGDKRILLLDGEALGAILRTPQKGDLRSNIHVGGSVSGVALDAQDQKIVAELREPLKQNGLYFVGIDVIAGKLTEINVTSPTGIQQMARLNQENLSARVVDWIEGHIY
ncbi:MAG: glutathione synthase [Myxococcales bacterium]|nr:MAG: glutathione synthase [Myxococcales bacterium]